MNSKINFTFDMRIKAPLIMIIISDRNSDMLAIDLGFVEIKTGEIRKIPQNGDNNECDSDLGIERNINKSESCDYSVSGLNFKNGASPLKEDYVNTYGDECSYRVISCSLSDIEVSLISVATEREKEKERDDSADRDRDRGRGSGFHQTQRSNNSNTNNNNNSYNQLSTNTANMRRARRSRLIDKLDIYIEAQLSEDPWGSDAAPIRIFCEMPVMNIR